MENPKSGSGFFSGADPGSSHGTFPGAFPGSFPGPFAGAFGGPTLNLPFGELAQGIDLMRTMWTQLLNSPITPTLDLEELERRIRDLKTVEQWLAVNQNLLRTTIQGLEIQRTTLATLKAFAGAMARPLREEPGGATANVEAPSAAHAPAASTASAAPPNPPEPGARRPKSPESQAAPFRTGAPTAETTKPAVSPGFAPAMEAAAQQAGQWWQFLQQQFRQLADSAASTLPRAPEPSSVDEDATLTRKDATAKREGGCASPIVPSQTPIDPSSGAPVAPPPVPTKRSAPKPAAGDRESPRQADRPRPRQAQPAQEALSATEAVARTDRDPRPSQGPDEARLSRIPRGPLWQRENAPRPDHPAPEATPARPRKRAAKGTLPHD